MADYQLTGDPDTVYRVSDGAWVPANNPANADSVQYLAWLAVPNTPDPYVAPLSTSVIDKSQFWMQAAIAGHISQSEAEDAMGGDIPNDISQFIHTLPSSVRFATRMAFLGDSFERLKPGAVRFKEAFNLTDPQMDAFFIAAGVL